MFRDQILHEAFGFVVGPGGVFIELQLHCTLSTGCDLIIKFSQMFRVNTIY